MANERALNMGRVLKTLILSTASLIRDRKVASRLVRHCLVATELVDWLLQLSADVHSRAQAAAMCQALLDEGILVAGKFQLQRIIYINLHKSA